MDFWDKIDDFSKFLWNKPTLAPKLHNDDAHLFEELEPVQVSETLMNSMDLGLKSLKMTFGIGQEAIEKRPKDLMKSSRHKIEDPKNRTSYGGKHEQRRGDNAKMNDSMTNYTRM